MRIRKIGITLLISGIFFMLTSTNAWAGREQRARWEGVAIGVVGTIVGQAILDQYRGPANVNVGVNIGHSHRGYQKPAYQHYPPPQRRHHGHWEFQKVWVPPVCRRAWNPGHYDRHGHWVRGSWIEVEVEPGYWIKERVWVGDYNNRPRRSERY